MDTQPVRRFIASIFGRNESSEGDSDLLNHYFEQVDEIILARQDFLTGLLPASTAITNHGDYTDAWVRDNVYSIMAAWGLAMAYKRKGIAPDRAYLLEQSVIKLMRGLLTAMMRQASKVERFKHTQNPIDSLHAKYGTRDGQEVVADDAWGHLQLDATSLYLVTLAQMIQSGLRIIGTLDEVNFIQNLVHYISRSYRTPDYGIWERGHKLNHGEPELNASSIGMALAALEAMDGLNLFGSEGGQASLVHVVADDIARTRIALSALLPRESISKEVDAALFSITGFPAFAVSDPVLKEQTVHRSIEKLEGRYGCKRFLLDGHQTVIEDPHRLHYEPHELKAFADIECEWPLFFCYQFLNHLFDGNSEAAAHYRARIEAIAIERDGKKLVPELYYVEASGISAERNHPGSQARLPNENVPLVWAQSLFILGCMISDELLMPKDVDPLNRHQPLPASKMTEVQVAILAETQGVKQTLDAAKLPAATRQDILPLEIRSASELSLAYSQVGRNDRMGLSGRPLRQIRTLSTARLYVLGDHPVVFIPQFLNQSGFYLAMDNPLLIERIKAELRYISSHWPNPQVRPLLLIDLHANMLEGPDAELLLSFLRGLSSEKDPSISARLIPLSEFAEDTAFERIGKLHDFQLSDNALRDSLTMESPGRHTLGLLDFNRIERPEPDETPLDLLENSALTARLHQTRAANDWLEILRILHERDLSASGDLPFSMSEILEDLYIQAGNHHDWRLIRITAALLGKYDINLEQAATEILVRQHGLTVGKSYSSKATFRRPADSSELLEAIRNFNPGNPSLQILIQELIIALGLLIKQEPALFSNLNTIRVGHILDVIIAREKRASGGSLDQAFERILGFAPHRLSKALRDTLNDYAKSETALENAESLSAKSEPTTAWIRDVQINTESNEGKGEYWLHWREQQGSVGRADNAFFEGVYALLGHCEGLMIGGKYNSHRRIDSLDIRSHMTAGEQTFKLRITHLLDRIQAPEYRELTVETLKVLSELVRTHPEIHFGDTLVTDILIGHAVRISWCQDNPGAEARYEEEVSEAWSTFLRQPPPVVAESIVGALSHLSAEISS
jgi:phosphorylase kinase alpha/beta subunit